jgi:hypothetical protein
MVSSDRSEPQAIGTVGGSIDQVSVSLAIYAHDLDPDVVTDLIGRPPTRSQRKGDVKGKSVARIGGWFVEEYGVAPQTVDEVVCRLLDKLPRDLSVWHELAAGYDVNLRFGLHVLSWNRGFLLPRELLQRLASMEVSLDFDIYADEPES